MVVGLRLMGDYLIEQFGERLAARLPVITGKLPPAVIPGQIQFPLSGNPFQNFGLWFGLFLVTHGCLHLP